jgi:hypothetical protein
VQIHLTPKNRPRRLAGAVAAVGALAMLLGLVAAADASAQAVARTGPTAARSASAPAAVNPSRCTWTPIPAGLFIGDPVALYPSIHGAYNEPGSKNVAFKITGPFPHSTTMSFTTYDDLMNITGPGYVLNDSDIIPNPGSVNPFVPGNRVMATPRDYTVWAWPDSVPVPTGLKNVVLYPTKPAYPPEKRATFELTMRIYHMQPGYRALAAMRATIVTAVSTTTLRPVRCPQGAPALGIASQVVKVLRHIKVLGPLVKAPEPKTGNKIYFTRYPGLTAIGPEGYPADGCVNYVMGTLSGSLINVTTYHRVPQYFNNDFVTPKSIMQDYQTRYISQVIARFPAYARITSNTDKAVYTGDGRWVTVWLPTEPRLTRVQLQQVRAIALQQHFNVVQLPPRPRAPLARLVPWPVDIVRNKAISPSFPYSVTSVPCWAQHHDYRTYTDQSSPAFFAKYASSPSNMGPYWVDGVKMTFKQFFDQYAASARR